MSRWAERKARGGALNEAETAYFMAIVGHLDGVPGVARAAMADEAVEMISGRPASTFDELASAIGRPVDVASRLRDEMGFVGSTSKWRRWWLLPRWMKAVQIAALVTLAGAGLAIRSYYVATPNILNACAGAVASEFETLRAAGETEFRMALRIGERYGVHLCPFSREEGVTIENIRLRRPVQIAIQPVGWELWIQGADPTDEPVGNAAGHAPWPADIEGFASVIVWFEAEYCNISGRISFDELALDYTYRGRSRTMDIPLGATYSVQSAPGQCSDAVRAADDRASAAWLAAVDEEVVWRTGGTPQSGGRGPLDLRPESISRDLCRYLRGVIPATGFDGEPFYDQFEPIEARAVFQLGSSTLAETLIDGAVLGICPEFADQRDDLRGMVGA